MLFDRSKIMNIEQDSQDMLFQKKEIKDYNVTIDGLNIFDQPVKDDIRTYENIRKIATG